MLAKIDHVFSQAPDDHVIGDENAAGEVIIYASTTCPHCADWFENQWPTFKKLEVDSGRNKVIFREFPTSPAELALAEFSIANAAPESQFMDQILYTYANQKQIYKDYKSGQTDEVLKQLGHHAGLKTNAQIEASLTDKQTRAHLEHTIKRAEAADVPGTPSFIIGGKLYSGPSNGAAALTIATEAARLQHKK